MRSISLVLCLLVLGGVTAAQNRSVYTSTRTTDCKTIKSNPDEGGSYEGECKGVGGYKVRLLEGDLRQTLNIISPRRKQFDLEFWSFYGGFSSIGEKIEWRTKGGTPIALIARYNVANAEDSSKNTSYLIVSKISESRSCVVEIVEPGPKQNVKARQLADAAAKKPCRTAE